MVTRKSVGLVRCCICMQDTFARATHSAYAAGRPSAARDDRVSCIQMLYIRNLIVARACLVARASKSVLHTRSEVII